VPVVVPPNPLSMLLQLLRTHTQLPAALVGKVVATLPETFPAALPYLQITKVPGGQTLVPQRLWTAVFDLNVYAAARNDADELARHLVGVVGSLEQRAATGGGFTAIEVADPFPLPDPSTAKRSVIPVTATYRPRRTP